MILSTADEQLEDGTKESLEESKGETEASNSTDGGNNSTAESTEQDGADEAEADADSVGQTISQNGTDDKKETVKDNTSEVTDDNIPVVGDEDSVKVQLWSVKQIKKKFTVILECKRLFQICIIFCKLSISSC